MKRVLFIAFLLLQSSLVFAADPFPHGTVIYEQQMKGPMGVKVDSNVYIKYSEGMDANQHLEAEWRTQKTPAGTERRLNLTKEGYIYSVDLDTKRCTKTRIKDVQQMAGDPRQLAQDMKKAMGLKKAGSCEQAGLKGIKYTSQFGTMCFYEDVFLLYQEGMGSVTKVTKVKFDKKLPKDKTRLPEGVSCEKGRSLEEMFGGGQTNHGAPEDAGTVRTKQRGQPPADLGEAMKMMNEMLKDQSQ